MTGYIGRAYPALKRLFRTDMKKQLICYALASALITISSIASGQKTYALGLGGGAAIPVGKLSDTQKTGFNAMVTLAIGVSDLPFGVRFDGIYNSLSRTDVTTAQGGTAINSELRVKAALANLVYAFPGTSSKAYIIAGGGLYNSKPDLDGAKAQNNFGVNGGLGATFGFGPVAAFIEARYHSISRSEAKGGVYQFVPITLGVMF
jgi:hypothetical protein